MIDDPQDPRRDVPPEPRYRPYVSQSPAEAEAIGRAIVRAQALREPLLALLHRHGYDMMNVALVMAQLVYSEGEGDTYRATVLPISLFHECTPPLPRDRLFDSIRSVAFLEMTNTTPVVETWRLGPLDEDTRI